MEPSIVCGRPLLPKEFGDSIGDGDGDVSDENWGRRLSTVTGVVAPH